MGPFLTFLTLPSLPPSHPPSSPFHRPKWLLILLSLFLLSLALAMIISGVKGYNMTVPHVQFVRAREEGREGGREGEGEEGEERE